MRASEHGFRVSANQLFGTCARGTARVADDLNVLDDHDFWSRHQPGFRFATEPIGSPEFFDAVERHRYSLEPAIAEKARFADWSGRDVLEAGCGIATDGISFARSGARYTGIDLSASATSVAQHRFELEGLDGCIIRTSITSLPVASQSQDLVYCVGVLHHLPQAEAAVAEMFRVLRPGGSVIVMVYHRGSLNYHVNIMLIRRALALTLPIPGFATRIARVHEMPEVIAGHRDLLRRHGLRYVADRQLFLNHNTDGPGNPLSRVMSRKEAADMFGRFENVQTAARFLNLRLYPAGRRLARTKLARRVERRYGWHLWLEATRPCE